MPAAYTRHHVLDHFRLPFGLYNRFVPVWSSVFSLWCTWTWLSASKCAWLQGSLDAIEVKQGLSARMSELLVLCSGGQKGCRETVCNWACSVGWEVTTLVMETVELGLSLKDVG